MEQREGRVHRYKGHAVRKNVAARHRDAAVLADGDDPWSDAFAAAAAEANAAGAVSELVPYWVYPIPDGARIERHVPAVPLSRDFARLDALRRSLAVYRITFGQSRQEDLVEVLLRAGSAGDGARLIDDLTIDLSPPDLPRRHPPSFAP
jgi:hypothetical protein